MILKFTLATKGFTDIIDITPQVKDQLQKSGVKEGLACIFVAGSTVGVTTIEYEPGLIEDLKRTFEKLVPQDEKYAHDKKWGDGNGFAHVRASLLKSSLSIPVEKGRLLLGTWQQIVLIDFDNRTREREILVKLLKGGEKR